MNKKELFDLFSIGSSERVGLEKHLQRNWSRRSAKLRKDANVVTNDELISGYHYLVCPVTGLPVYSFGKPYSDKLGITMEEFYALFPDFDGVTSSPFNEEMRSKNKSNKEKLNATYIYVNGKEFDLNVIKRNVKTRFFHTKDENCSELVEGYHYITCPITGDRTNGFNVRYFNRLDEVGITKEDFIAEFPDINLELNKSTPEFRGVSLDEFRSGIVKHEHSKVARRNILAEYKNNNPDYLTRNMNLTLNELIDKILSKKDPIIEQYISNRSQVDLYNKLSSEVGVDVEDLEENYHYVIHPFTGLPMSRIGIKSINVFGITEERFYEWFPELMGTKITQYASEKIKSSLMKKDGDGIRPIDRSNQGRQKKFAEVMEDGRTYQEVIAERTKNTHLSTIDEYGRNGYQRLADKNIDKSIATKSQDVQTSEYARYRMIVLFVMSKLRPYFRSLNVDFGTWNTSDYNPETHYQVDHKFSIEEGFKQRISPLCIANIDNLDIVTGLTNTTKRGDCSITLEQLEQMSGMSKHDMTVEFDAIMTVVRRQIKDGELSSTMNTLIEAGHDIALKLKPYNDFYRQYQYKDNE